MYTYITHVIYIYIYIHIYIYTYYIVNVYVFNLFSALSTHDHLLMTILPVHAQVGRVCAIRGGVRSRGLCDQGRCARAFWQRACARRAGAGAHGPRSRAFAEGLSTVRARVFAEWACRGG